MSDGFKDALTGLNFKSISPAICPQCNLPNFGSSNSQLCSCINVDYSDKKELKEGTKYDEDKPRLDLIPASTLDALGQILTMGAKKYADNNWRKGIKYSRVISAIMRHLNAWREGDTIDKESGKSHMWHVACNVAFLIEYEANPEKYKDFDDRWIK